MYTKSFAQIDPMLNRVKTFSKCQSTIAYNEISDTAEPWFGDRFGHPKKCH